MNSISIASRRFGPASAVLGAWLAVGAAVPIPIVQPAYAQSAVKQTDPEDFVRDNVQRGLNILNNRSLSDAERRAQVREFVASLTDIRRIALFTLGPARGSGTPAEIERFVDAFRDYTVAVYESRLKAYSGQSLRVTGCTAQAANDYVVRTVFVDPTARTEQRGEPMEVNLRVVNDNGRYVVTDVSVVGIWLALEERDQFANYLEDHNGNLGGLIVHLNVLTERLRAGDTGRSVTDRKVGQFGELMIRHSS